LESSVGELEDLHDNDIEKMVSKYHQDYINERYGLTEEKSNKKFVLKLVTATLIGRTNLDAKIKNALDKVDSFAHMNLLMLSILRCAVAEMVYFDTPPKVAIKEYMKISDSFFSESEVRFVNGVLDKITKV